MIPQLQNARFCLIEKGSKKPFEKDWPNNTYPADSEKFQKHIAAGGNYGVVCGASGFIVLDCDSNELEEIAKAKLPQTFKVRTGSGKAHYYFNCDLKKKSPLAQNGKHLGDLQAGAAQVVGPNSLHPSGGIYQVELDVPVAPITEEELKTALEGILEKEPDAPAPEPMAATILKSEYNIPLDKIIDLHGFKYSSSRHEWQGPNPLHSDREDNDLTVNLTKGTWHCFWHNSGGGAYEWLAVRYGLIPCDGAKKGALRGELFKRVIEIARKDGLIPQESIAIPPIKPTPSVAPTSAPAPAPTPEELAKQAELDAKSLEYLKQPNLLDAFVNEIGKKVVGEADSSRAIFLYCCKVFDADYQEGVNNLMVNAAPSVGKDYVTRAITTLFPDRMVESLRRASANAFTYWHSNDAEFTWAHKICRLTDISNDLLESSAFKTFLTDDEKSIIVNKSAQGRTGAEELKTTGRPVLLTTSANANPNEEMMNRFEVLTLDESTEQTRAITRYQLAKAAGTVKKADYLPEATNALGLLKPVKVVVPYAEKLSKYLHDTPRARRDVPRFISLIRASAALNQHQRERDSDGKVVASGEDYENARKAMQKIQVGVAAGITRALMQVYNTCMKWQNLNMGKMWTIKEIHAFAPRINERNYYKSISRLAETGILEANLRETQFKPISEYIVLPLLRETTILPPWEVIVVNVVIVACQSSADLCQTPKTVVSNDQTGLKTTITTQPTDTTNTTNTTITTTEYSGTMNIADWIKSQLDQNEPKNLAILDLNFVEKFGDAALPDLYSSLDKLRQTGEIYMPKPDWLLRR